MKMRIMMLILFLSTTLWGKETRPVLKAENQPHQDKKPIAEKLATPLNTKTNDKTEQSTNELAKTVGAKASISKEVKLNPSEKSVVLKTTPSLIDNEQADLFVVPDVLRQDVSFWAKVYREWDINQVVIYDSPTKVVYTVLNLPRIGSSLSSQIYRKDVQKEVTEIKEILRKMVIGEKVDPANPLFSQVATAVKQNDLLRHEDIHERLRFQNGLRSQFEFGLKVSGRYADDMKAVLKSQNLPDELLAVVFVESLFYLTAQSHAGASGPWGIMRETAISSGIHVNKFTDERIDPVVSTWGAARYLKKARDGLQEWPLIITSYNYGYPGMLRAVNNLGSNDFAVILAKHESPIFKFASKNYYAEFLAAVDTLRNQEKYFPGLEKDRRWDFEFVQVQRPVLVDDLLAVGALSKEDLSQLNPSLTRFTIAGAEVIPADYALRVPRGKSKNFYAKIQKIPASKRGAAGLKLSSKYQARGKESLNAIARRLGISAELLGERLGKPLEYKPTGAVNIRSRYHLFSRLLEINKNVLSTLATGQIVENPPQITTAQ